MTSEFEEWRMTTKQEDNWNSFPEKEEDWDSCTHVAPKGEFKAESNLSEKKINPMILQEKYPCYLEKDVKEFIKDIKENIWEIMGKDIEKREKILMMIEAKAGRKLT
jgi:hypothetical protein